MKILRYRDWTVLGKIMVIPIVSLVVLILGVEFGILPFLSDRVMAQKKIATRQAVEVAYGILEDHARQAKEGKMPLEEARKQSAEAVRLLRYSGKEYFWIHDLTKPVPVMVMHPTVPALDGKVLDDPKFNKATSLQEGVDGNKRKLDGANLFVAFNEAVATKGEGYVTYQWPKPKEGGGVTTELYEKLSYVKKFDPWGWVIGSGIYVDDVKGEVMTLRLWIYAGAITFITLLLLVTWSVGRGIRRSLLLVANHLKEMATGDADLTQRLVVDRQDETGMLADSFNIFLENLQKIIGLVMQNATQVAAAAVELKKRAEGMAASSDRVAADATTVATAAEEMSATSSDIARSCMNAVDASGRTSELARGGAEVVNQTIAVMGRIASQVQSSAATVQSLGAKSDQIGAIVGTIQDIADQTNLLALNAAIEAARAGEQGRGFAVVADEVRALAERTTKATREIGEMIKAIQTETGGAVQAMQQGVKEVEEGTREAARSGDALTQILSQVDQVTMQINQIATAAEEQSATIGEISGNIVRITDDARQSAQVAADTSEVTGRLNKLSEALISAIDRFRFVIRWNPRMSVLVPKFDEQHKQLVAMVHELNDAMKDGQGDEVIGSIIGRLAEYAVNHFNQEEAFMRETGYPGLAAHHAIHEDLKKKVGEAIEAFEKGEIVPAAIMQFLSDWLINHIMKEDRKYGEHAKKSGKLM
ncbi:MAG: methyl-accepting chemotaxis protein [Desulfuromonadia bacterium]